MRGRTKIPASIITQTGTTGIAFDSDGQLCLAFIYMTFTIGTRIGIFIHSGLNKGTCLNIQLYICTTVYLHLQIKLALTCRKIIHKFNISSRRENGSQKNQDIILVRKCTEEDPSIGGNVKKLIPDPISNVAAYA